MNKDFKFEDLYEAIYKILPNEDLQELMDVCYEITGVPILIVDIMYNVYGIAPLHPVGNENRDYLLEHRTYDDERVQLMYNDWFYQFSRYEQSSLHHRLGFFRRFSCYPGYRQD